MKCPFCGEINNKVIDSRLSKDGMSFAGAGNVLHAVDDLQPTSILKKSLL